MSSPPRPRLTREGRRAAGLFVWLVWTAAAVARYLDGADLQAAGLAVLGVVTAAGLVTWGDRRARAREGAEWTPGSGDGDGSGDEGGDGDGNGNRDGDGSGER
jgi:hypothetical protein